MASTAGAARALAAVRQRQLLAFLSALDTFHAAEQRIEAGVDPTNGAPLAAGAAPQALAAATSRLAEAMHAAIDAGWRAAFDTGMLEVHGGAAPPPSALRVLQAEAASQKAYATRFASDVAAGVPTQPGRWSEGRRSAAYADATEAAYQVAGGVGAPDGGLIWWRLGEVVNHCAECPIIAANSPYTRESLPTVPRAGATPCVFTPDSPVLTRRGMVPIRDVMVGDEVWTHRSRWRRVVNTFINPSGGRRGVFLNGVGFTEEHRVWTVDGWRTAADVASCGVRMLHLQHAEELREMFGDDALGSSYESMPTVRELLCLWESEGPASRGMSVLRDEPQGHGTVGGPGDTGENDCGDCEGWAETTDNVRSPDVGQLHSAESRGRSILGEVLGRGRAPVHLPIQVGLADGQRSDPVRDGDSPHQRGSDRRPDRELGDADCKSAPDAPHDSREGDGVGCRPGRFPEESGPATMRHVSDGVHGTVSRGEGVVREVLLSRVCERGEVQTVDCAVYSLHEGLPADPNKGPELLQPEVLRSISVCGSDDGLPDVWDLVRVPSAQEPPTEVLFVEVLPAHVYDLEVEDDRSFFVGGVFAENCRASCKCTLTTSPPTTPPQRTQAERDESAARDTPFEDRVYNPPPLPPGTRLPTAEERAALRDLEIQRNEARRRAHDAELAGNEREARIWRGRSRDLTGEIRRYADERGVHHVPTFRVGDVVTGRDIGRRDIDRLTHLRGIDGATMARAQSQAIADALAAAKRNLLADLETYPDMGGWTKADWTAALKQAGAPPSAFGGDLIRLGTESTCCGEAECGACRDRLSATVAASERGGACACRATTRAAGRVVLALEATAAPTPAADLPAPEDWRVVNAIGPTARATLRSHVAAFETLAKAGRRSGVAPYRVSVGPFADGWSDLVASGGTWVQGPVAEVERFFKAWAALATDDIVTATWQPM